MKTPERILLVDQSQSLCNAWSQAFASFDHVEVVHGDFFSRDADAMVSPANSFGIMDGGLDLAIRDALGAYIQPKVQQAILERHHGELHVGSAEVVATDHARWPYLVVAPTMRVPEPIAHTMNAYTAFRAILLEVGRHNSSHTKSNGYGPFWSPGSARASAAWTHGAVPRKCEWRSIRWQSPPESQTSRSFTNCTRLCAPHRSVRACPVVIVDST